MAAFRTPYLGSNPYIMHIHVVDTRTGVVYVKIDCTLEEFTNLPRIGVNDAKCVIKYYTNDYQLIDIKTGELCAPITI